MPEAISRGRTLGHLIAMVLDAKATLEEEAEQLEATFSRGLDDDFVTALNREYGEDGWWRKLVDDKETFVAIRDNRVNVYYCGCSLAEVWMESGKVVGRTHYKYLLRPSADAPFVRFEDGVYRLLGDASELFVESPADVGSLKQASKPFAGEEKTGIQGIIKANPNILDVEIAFGMRRTSTTGPAAPRIDFAALQTWESGLQVVFYEAKRFGNRGELRAEKDMIPVVSQIQTYEELLKANRTKIETSYRRVCCNLRRLDGVRERHPDRHRMLRSMAGKTLVIEERPRLVVFGFDNDQKFGKAWEPHRDALVAALGEERVLLKGTTTEFRTGISAATVG